MARLIEIAGPSAVMADAADRALYRRDASILHAEPGAVVAPGSVAELVAVVLACREFEVPFCPRGAGTGVAGGATPLAVDQPPVVITTARMRRILELDPAGRTATVEPGVPNLSLSQAAAPLGLRYAPDPSSQVVSTLGGNVATNAGGAHCLGHGVTSNHVLWVDLLDADGVVHRLGSTAPEGSGLDLRALAVGSEGTFGLVTAACLRLIPIAPATVTLLAGFPSVRSAAEAVADVVQHLGRLVALELMDRTAVQLVEAYAPAGYPTGAGAVLLAELEGLPHAVADDTRTAVELIGRHRGGPVQVAESAERRALLWKGRKSVAGAMARLKPDYYLHDCVVPRSRLADVVDEIEGIAARHGLTVVSCHHAGDGNLHPLLPFDKSDPEELEHALIAGHEILAAALAHGGVVTGEHGVGIEKRDLLCEAFSGPELDLQRAVRHALDPSGRCNPGKVLPSPATCGELPAALVPEGAWI